MTTIKITKLNTNPTNPRTITKDKLDKLKRSIATFQKMMEIRPIVVDENWVVLGGNQRLAAIKALKLEEIPSSWVKQVLDLTEDEKQEFIIKDNVGFGEWDWDMLANEWDEKMLNDWGLDVPSLEDVESIEEDKPKFEPPSLTITFASIEDLQAAMDQIEAEIVPNYHGAWLTAKGV